MQRTEVGGGWFGGQEREQDGVTAPVPLLFSLSLSLFCGALDKNPFRLLKTDRNEADAYTDVRRMGRG